jgi:hypothetical protein
MDWQLKKSRSLNIAARFRITVHASILFSVLLLGTNCVAGAQVQPTSGEEASLKAFLQNWDTDKTTRYVAAFRDLNGDGKPEAIVYLLGKWCGSGGCTTLILTPDGGSWRIVTKITVVQLPIRVLANKTNGWDDIGVWVQGGGIQMGHEAELRFDGKSYPRNPSVPAAKRLKGKSGSEIVIESARGAVLLH